MHTEEYADIPTAGGGFPSRRHRDTRPSGTQACYYVHPLYILCSMSQKIRSKPHPWGFGGRDVCTIIQSNTRAGQHTRAPPGDTALQSHGHSCTAMCCTALHRAAPRCTGLHGVAPRCTDGVMSWRRPRHSTQKDAYKRFMLHQTKRRAGRNTAYVHTYIRT